MITLNPRLGVLVLTGWACLLLFSNRDVIGSDGATPDIYAEPHTCEPLEIVRTANLTIKFHRVINGKCGPLWQYDAFSIYRDNTKLFEIEENYF